MEAALLARLREDPDVIAVAGVYNGEPAIDYDERKSNDVAAFPAAIQSLVVGDKNYDQDGADGARTARMRWECFGLDPDAAFFLAQAIVDALEPKGEFGGVRFGRGFLVFERGFPPEEVADLRIFRRIVDLNITATY